MRSKNAISPEAFNDLLDWLDRDREIAGKKYELIRRGLIQLFENYGCVDAEDLADITIDRVCAKVAVIKIDYSGDPASYFYGVGHKVRLEHHKARREYVPESEIASEEAPAEPGASYTCMQECLDALLPQQRDLILDYYLDTKSAKIQRRKQQAAALGIEPGTLRIRAHRIRTILENCVKKCLKRTKR